MALLPTSTRRIISLLRLAADADFNYRIIRGLVRRNPSLDIIAIRDIGMAELVDPYVLEWAAESGRVLLTHDVSTMRMYATERLRNSRAMPGLVIVHQWIPIGRAIDDILALAERSTGDELANPIVFLPLR